MCSSDLDTSCEFDPLDGTYGEFPCRGRYYPDGVAGSGIGELGWESDGYRTCLFGARAEGAALGLSPRPVGADADAETAGYSLASCSTDGVYDAEGTLTVE